jgi:hypothetical protein
MLVERGKLPYYKIGNLVRFRKSEIDAFLDKCRREPREREVRVRKERGTNTTKDVPASTNPKNAPGDMVVPSGPSRTAGVCRPSLRRADGKIYGKFPGRIMASLNALAGLSPCRELDRLIIEGKNRSLP